ncbi:porin family protein [Wenyingzhuangia sp. IMCC45467]
MKNLLLSTIAICVISISSYAQDELYKKSSVGIKGGYNLASAIIDGDADVNNRHGFHVGFYNEIYLHNNFAVQTELLYSQQGYKIETDAGDFTQKLDYLNLPIMFKGYLNKNFYVETGPQVGVALSHKEEIDADFDYFDSTEDFTPNDFDFGANIGTGFKTDSGLNIGVRYYFGLTDVYSEENQKNRLLQASIGFSF